MLSAATTKTILLRCYRGGMKLSISLPDDHITALLTEQPNVSNYIYRAVRRMLVAEELARLPAPSADETSFADAAQAATLDAWAADE